MLKPKPTKQTSKYSTHSTASLFVLPLALIGLTATMGTLLSSTTVSADNNTDVVDRINITVPVSCTISGTGTNSHNAEIANGIYTADIGTTTLHAFCNDSEGFAIYAAGYTGNEIGGTNSNKLVGTSASSNATIDTGLATTTGSPDVSNWAMKLAITQDSGDTTGTNAFTIDSAPNTSGGADASFSSYHVVPNEYTKVAHKDSNTDMTASIGGVKLTTTYAAYISKTQAADTYSGQVIYTLVHPSSAAAPLVCKPSGTTITTIACMQDIAATNKSSIMASMDEGTAYTLYDSRDEQPYHVAKLADGNIWMLDNLALDPTDPTTAQNMNASNTNATTEAIDNLLNGGSTTTGWSNEAVINASGVLSYTSPIVNNVSKDNVFTSPSLAGTIGETKLGIYYNFCAASASTYCYEGWGTDIRDTLIDAPQDICPVNWRMPTGGDTGEYQALVQEYSSDAVEANSLQYNLSTPPSSSNWWSSTFDYQLTMYILQVSEHSVGESFYYRNRSFLSFMRCLVSE